MSIAIRLGLGVLVFVGLSGEAGAQGMHRGPDGKFSMSLCVKNNSAARPDLSRSTVEAHCRGIQQQHAERRRLQKQQQK